MSACTKQAVVKPRLGTFAPRRRWAGGRCHGVAVGGKGHDSSAYPSGRLASSLRTLPAAIGVASQLGFTDTHLWRPSKAPLLTVGAVPVHYPRRSWLPTYSWTTSQVCTGSLLCMCSQYGAASQPVPRAGSACRRHGGDSPARAARSAWARPPDNTQEPSLASHTPPPQSLVPLATTCPTPTPRRHLACPANPTGLPHLAGCQKPAAAAKFICVHNGGRPLTDRVVRRSRRQ